MALLFLMTLFKTKPEWQRRHYTFILISYYIGTYITNEYRLRRGRNMIILFMFLKTLQTHVFKCLTYSQISVRLL